MFKGHSTLASLRWYCWAGYLNGNQDFVLYPEIVFFNQLYPAECLFKLVFNFSSICKFVKLFQWMCIPSRKFICMDCSTAYTNLLSLIICVGTQQPIKTPKSLKGRKVKKLFHLQQTSCYWKIFLKKHSSWAILLRPCQVLKSWAVARGSSKVQNDKNE